MSYGTSKGDPTSLQNAIRLIGDQEHFDSKLLA
jgi:hypothetical protein